MEKFIQTLEAQLQATKTSLRNEEASIHKLKNQICQLTNLVLGRQQGNLPKNIELNPKEHVKVVAPRDEKELRGGEFENLAQE